jgi:hypothetical protein
MKKDYITHFCAGAMVAALVGLPAYLESLNLFSGLWPAITSGLLAAGIKEMCDDNTDGNNWDWKDFGATAIGVLVVAVFIILLNFGKG